MRAYAERKMKNVFLTARLTLNKTLINHGFILDMKVEVQYSCFAKTFASVNA